MNWHDFFTYDADTGNLIWKHRDLCSFANERMGKVWNTRFAGKVAGGMSGNGYLNIVVNGLRCPVARVVWEMHKGALAKGEYVDHVNGSKTINRIDNLRKCSNTENCRNSRRPKNNTSGFKGVTRAMDGGKPGKWIAQITVDRNHIHLGRFDTPEKAHDAYCEAALLHHGQFARTA